jgi:Carboxypeptidase regulatory-like domain/TonB dependent receptor-like, beta-barrel
MERGQSVFALIVRGSTLTVLLCVLVLICAGKAAAQVNTATLSGTVTDPQALGVKSAKVTVTNVATGSERSGETDDTGRYSLVGLPPGRYKMSVDGGASFAAYRNESIVVTVGENATLDPRLELRGLQQSVTVTAETAAIETAKTDVSQTIEQRRIDNLPINGRSYINFTLINSQTTRDVAPTIGPAPSSGLNFGGQRARSNMVSVDGADAVDNSINGIRATVSQEAVQEFQLIQSNYNAEYGRATGGVVNIVTKSGGNDFHGNAFGFLRNKAFQSRNAFSGQVDPITGQLNPVKQGFTRVQAGATLGGAFKKDKTFYFFSYEYTQREETGFSSIGAGNFGFAPLNCGTGCPLNGLPMTASQATAVNSLLQAATASGSLALLNLAKGYAAFVGSAASVAVNGIDPGLICGTLCPPPPGQATSPGARFPIPVNCPPSATVGTVTCTPIGGGLGEGLAALPTSFVPLASLRGNFPVMEKTSLWSGRLDQRWNNNNSSFVRVSVSPSLVTGIESTAQNQVFGQNSGSRTGLNQSRDISVVFQHDTIVSDKAVNQFRFQFARRGLHFGFSQLPGGDQIAVNIPGSAYFGREPYSPVDRIERRWEFTDNVSVIRGKHTFRMGGDYNLIQLRSSKQQIFQLDFGGVANFGGQPISVASGGLFPNSVPLGPGQSIALPGTSGAQMYGLGLPTTWIQGIGQSKQPFDNIPMGFFFQDSWRVSRKVTLNYGVRYDVEITPLFAAATPLNAAAEQALGVVEGLPRDFNNVAPRFGLAWDPKGDGKTVIRMGYGLFYDHPLLAIPFDATTADGGRSVQLITGGATASACGVVLSPLQAPPGYPLCAAGNGPQNLNGSTIFQGVLNQLPSMGYLPNQQRFDPFFPNSLFANQNYLQAGFPLSALPFTLPVAKNFQYGSAQQANLTIEREIAGSWKISAGYQYTHGVHLYRPVDINSTDPQLLTQNLFNAGASGLSFSSPATVVVPGNAAAFSCLATGAASSIFVMIPGVLAQGHPGSANCSTPSIGFISTPSFFNFFRLSGPNPSFAALVTGIPAGLVPFFPNGLPAGYAGQVALAKFAGYPVGLGAPVPFNSVDAQLSNGNSVYHGLTVNVTKRFSHGMELLSSYTYSHSIDDSSDLQSILEPQDSRFPNVERANSDNDQRHRWVTSAVFQSPSAKQGDSAWKHFIGDFTLAPIIEVSSGRPYTLITGTDFRLDLGASSGRPSVGTGGAPSNFIHGVTFVVPNNCLTNAGTPFSVPGITTLGFGCDGNLGRNPYVTPGFFQLDLRLSRRFALGERVKLDVIADGFNLLNRLNVAAVNQSCNPSDPSGCLAAGQPTASYDARQFQFALKLSW